MAHCTIILGVIGILIAAGGAFLGWYLFPSVVHKQVEEGVIIADGSEQYERFVKLPQPISFKVYIFNVTNVNRIQQGAIPVVEEVGPYVYKQYRKKRVKQFSRDGSKVTFLQDYRFEFDPDASAPYTESDTVVALNMHMNAFLQVFEREITDILQGFANRFNRTLSRTPGVRVLKRLMERIRGKRKSLLQIAENDPGLSLLLMHLNANLREIFNDPRSMFVTTSVKQYLFDGVRFCINPQGLARAICKQIKDQGSKTIRALDDGSLAFSFFYHKNQTGDDVYEVHTGRGDAMKLMEIQKLDEVSTLQVWPNSSDSETSICNLINGTDASAFPPFRKRGDSMYIFSADICRSVELFYQGDVAYKGIPGFRYSIGDNFLNDIGPEYSNECFCVDKLTNVIKRKNGCLYSGAMDLTTCLDAPVILTLPHMLGASNEYKKMIRGLRPDPKKHQTFVDVQQLTGTPLQGGKRVQFNMFLKSINKITLTENLTTVLMPAIWVDEGVQLNAESVQLLKSKLLNSLKILNIVHWSILCAGIAITLTSTMFYFAFRNKSEDESKVLE
ncbi:sensory neuron membrane protein 2 isoform X1 [Eupeodes corollae]|uniref:sensory neuron membrane protein 2 isoform X1 n=1 Tax=Eupeodes corollae TaxID=290404 RepID=UPI00249211F1|nr:sensory neuron membrane protein 2 isoform X1 [Eupeodes corollae]XP_055909083.1 sensory neuron membrane protein 2 isoform X1 [Eupeodes corollae]XP_055909084.1 sensory neuron membrane protein 2 isoform X1 [Eupeodes corollae]XP_055909085.1 sensory neuron membrane protein 2 isoform X1 [Eupeodes corollae]XP_055909086.1 sensory neuron membrane protein 2 isoform X1 [Eupeodes corollae]